MGTANLPKLNVIGASWIKIYFVAEKLLLFGMFKVFEKYFIITKP